MHGTTLDYILECVIWTYRRIHVSPVAAVEQPTVAHKSVPFASSVFPTGRPERLYLWSSVLGPANLSCSVMLVLGMYLSRHTLNFLNLQCGRAACSLSSYSGVCKRPNEIGKIIYCKRKCRVSWRNLVPNIFRCASQNRKRFSRCMCPTYV